MRTHQDERHDAGDFDVYAQRICTVSWVSSTMRFKQRRGLLLILYTYSVSHRLRHHVELVVMDAASCELRNMSHNIAIHVHCMCFDGVRACVGLDTGVETRD